jgi:hypothetical protein
MYHLSVASPSYVSELFVARRWRQAPGAAAAAPGWGGEEDTAAGAAPDDDEQDEGEQPDLPGPRDDWPSDKPRIKHQFT